MPLLTLDYFLTQDVYADDAFTPEIEPAEPFTLGVRVTNTGQGVAQDVRIESAQPRIVDNELGLLINFQIIGSSVDDSPATPSLLADLGDIDPNESTVARWTMQTTLSGEFVEFNADFVHADELGGELTSLLEATYTHFLVHDVRVDLPGRDAVRDFLAKDGDVLRVYESHGLDSEVTDQSANATLDPAGQKGSQVDYTLIVPPTAGFLYVRLPDPQGGAKEITRVMRSDGKLLAQDNAWLSRTRRQDNGWDHFINLFDADGTGQYVVTMDAVIAEPQPPVLQYIPDRTTYEGNQVSFLVEASDPNGTFPEIAAAPLPAGATFIEDTQGPPTLSTYVFDWTPAIGQAGDYDIEYTATDGDFEVSQTARITVCPFDNPGFRRQRGW